MPGTEDFADLVSLYRHIAGKLRRINGWKKPTVDSPHPVLEAGDSPSLVSIPPEKRASVQDQGSEGDCAAQAGRELVTGLGLREGHGEILYSMQALYYWARLFDGSGATDDTGTSVATIMSVLANRGIPLIEAWDDFKPMSLKPDAAAEANAAQNRALLVFALPDIATIKASIRDGFAVELGFDCPKSLDSAQTLATGDVELPDDPNEFEGGHAVSIVEADDNYPINGRRGALLANFHWSQAVGLNGYFHLDYEFLRRGHASDAHTIRLATV